MIDEHERLSNITLIQGKAQTQDWWNGKLFDKILLDAPCSATGVIRRHPDIKLLGLCLTLNKCDVLNVKSVDIFLYAFKSINIIV
jgi:hypothetical protein